MAQSAVSCWQAAFAQLPPDTQKALDSIQKKNPTLGSSSAEIDGIISLSKAKQAQCESKQWVVKIGSRHVNVRHAFSRMVDWLDKFKAFGDMAMNVDPVHAALPWAAFRFILQSFITEREQMGYIVAIMEDAARLVHHGKVFENLYLGAGSRLQDPIGQEPLNDLRNDTVELYVAILEGLTFCCSQMQKHPLRRVGSALFKPEDAKNASERLHNRWVKLKEQAQKCDSLRILQISDEIQRHLPGVFSTLDKILVKMQDQERIEMLKGISATPYRGHHMDIQERRTKGTGEWILQSDELQQWQASETSTITLLYGAPGAGKTFLTSRVIDHVEQSPNLEGFAYFYCKRDEKERSQPVIILRSLVRQLSSTFQRSGEIHQEVKTLAQNIEAQALTFSVGLCQNILSKLVLSYSNTTIILDALDECNMGERSHLMTCLSQLIDQHSTLKIFISSRKDADIIRHFESQPIIEIHATDNQHDIESFVKAELARDKRWDSLKPKLKHKIISTLFRMSRGMFQWAALQVQHLTQLAFWSESLIKDRLGKLPKTLEKAYDEIWQMILLKDGIESRLAKRAISWVLCSPQPLTTEELSIAIKIETDGCDKLFDFHDTLMEKDILSLCCNLLKLEKEVDRWQFCHLSAAEYIENRLVDQLQPYRKTALACIKYLLAMCHCQANRYLSLDRLINWNWPEFLEGQENAEDELLCQLLFRFLGSPHVGSRAYRSWVTNYRPSMSVQWTYSSPLWVICDSGLTWVLEEWCKNNHNVDVNSCDEHNESLLHFAAKRGHDELCRFLLRKGADITRGRLSPLLAACVNGDEATVRVLIEAGATINKVYGLGEEAQTPIQAAILSAGEPTAVVRLLLDHQADINIRNLAGETALDIAILSQRKTIIPLLLHHGARLGNPSLSLVNAAQNNMVDSIEKCIGEGADVNGSSDEGSTPLIAASICGHLEAIKRLVELGADVNMIQNSTYLLGETALISAARRGNAGSIKLLLSQGANPNIHGQRTSPLIEAARHNITIHCLEALLDAGANVNFASRTSGVTALIMAIRDARPDKIKTLLRAGADPNLSIKNFSPLTAALGHGKYTYDSDTMVRILLDAGADPNYNNGFSNCLCLAAVDDCLRTLWRRLIELGADPTLTFKEGPGSALATAVLHGNTRFCRFLLSPELGVNPNARLHGLFDSALFAAIRGEAVRDARLHELFGSTSFAATREESVRDEESSISFDSESSSSIDEGSGWDSSSEVATRYQFEQQFDEDLEDNFNQILDNLGYDRLNETFNQTGRRPLESYREGSKKSPYKPYRTTRIIVSSSSEDSSEVFSEDCSEGPSEASPEDFSDDSLEDDLNVIEILLRSGADIPMPIYRALGPVIPDLQLWGAGAQ
ncbi:unnamed protein product [Clonostachys rhizophaga]|uniref:NACHT domain-containing protein n=1 Tax=Clonostachys rhizophaga TaxID=160324 RepID=A0A9N9V5Q1_9HYPO|nr:unnamed protein product [Clonostachys rhizophaga]